MNDKNDDDDDDDDTDDNDGDDGDDENDDGNDDDGDDDDIRSPATAAGSRRTNTVLFPNTRRSPSESIRCPP